MGLPFLALFEQVRPLLWNLPVLDSLVTFWFIIDLGGRRRSSIRNRRATSQNPFNIDAFLCNLMSLSFQSSRVVSVDEMPRESCQCCPRKSSKYWQIMKSTQRRHFDTVGTWCMVTCNLPWTYAVLCSGLVCLKYFGCFPSSPRLSCLACFMLFAS